MQFTIDEHLLAEARVGFAGRENLFWILGGAGSGKTTICQALSTTHKIPVYDMDSHIYGTYFGRYSSQKHPVNMAWSTAGNGLQWLLNMSWEEYNQFNQAALVEYLDLLAQDLSNTPISGKLLVDGGVWHPALLARVLPTQQIVCLSAGERQSAEIWQENDERLAMKQAIDQLPQPEKMWQKFLMFDGRITRTILDECLAYKITVFTRQGQETIDSLANKVAHSLRL